MDPHAQASFIPKKPLVGGGTSAVAGKGLVWIVTLFLFIVAVAGAVSVFLYQQYLTNHIDAQSQTLAQAQAAFDPSAITDLVRINDRLAQAKLLLDTHQSPSQVFAYLEQNTLENVRFTSMTYEFDANGQIALTLAGQAKDFASVALQSDQFSRSRVLHNVLFSDVNTDAVTGGAKFKVTATIDPALVSYKDAILAQGSAQTQPAATAPAQTGTSTPSSSGAQSKP